MATPVPGPTRISPTKVVLAVLLVVMTVIAAVSAFGWFSATRPKPVPAQVRVVGSAAYTRASVTVITAAGSTSDELDASADNRNTYWTTDVDGGDLVMVTVTPLASDKPSAATVGCRIIAADGTTVLAEQSGLRGTQAVCTWRNL